MPGELFGPIFTSDELLAATGDTAWLQALLDAEAALALAEADAGVVPREAAQAIQAACRADRFDPAALGRAARGGGNPVIPLVAALSDAVDEEAKVWVHWGATSQDILDTAAVLVARRSLALMEPSLSSLIDSCAALARDHRDTVMVGRTLLQPALPVTFGLKAAGWLVAALDARRHLAEAGAQLAAQLGGAAGTLASLGREGPAVAGLYAARLGIAEPVLPWHTARQRMAWLAAALGVAAGTAAKVSTDVALMMQAEVGEAAEPAAPGRGGSSTLPHKRNPVAAASVGAATRRVHALVGVMLGAMVAEHERAVGAWHSEWETLSELLALAGGAMARAAETVAGLEVHADAMASNLERTGGVIMAERVSLALTPRTGRRAAAGAVGAAARRAAGGGGSFRDELAREDAIGEAGFGPGDLEGLLNPAGYLGSASAWIDRALAARERAG